MGFHYILNPPRTRCKLMWVVYLRFYDEFEGGIEKNIDLSKRLCLMSSNATKWTDNTL